MRFRDTPPQLDAPDRQPSNLPRHREPTRSQALSGAYLRAPLLDMLDLRRPGRARDVHALDEVARSAWFEPGGSRPREEPTTGEAGPPLFPLTSGGAELAFSLHSKSATRGVHRITDRKGHSYSLVMDPVEAPGTRAQPLIIASTLMRALGYLTPDVYLMHVDPGELDSNAPASSHVESSTSHRSASPPLLVAALRYPLGTDLGPTPPADVRPDDPNDAIAHVDRRSLRTLGFVASWLGLSRIDGSVLRDDYRGAPGEGYVLHNVVDLGDAFGAGADLRSRPLNLPRRGVSPWLRLCTLGFCRDRPASESTDAVTDAGLGAGGWTGALRGLERPFPPVERALPDDLYWAAKRIASLDEATIDHALDAAELEDQGARSAVKAALVQRRGQLVRHALLAVSPMEFLELRNGAILLEEAPLVEFAPELRATRWSMRVLGPDGDVLGDLPPLATLQGPTWLPLPHVGAQRHYWILELRAERVGATAPRAMQLHFSDEAALHVVGVRH